jgi:SAM-dependent methyltransferase
LIDQASNEKKYEVAQKVYSDDWAITSENHYKAGHYKWMSERISTFKPKRILDIGCGTGHGLLALYEILGPKITVIAVDENSACLDIANTTLEQLVPSRTMIKRLEINLSSNGYTYKFPPICEKFTDTCTLIEGDICNDKPLIDALLDCGDFDVVTVWLTGTHKMRQRNTHVQQSGINSEGDHRLYAQNNVYELACKLLKSGGVLQVVDRSEAPTSELLKNECLKAHRDQASVTTLEVQKLEYLTYDDPNDAQSTLKLTIGLAGSTFHAILKWLLSQFYRKNLNWIAKFECL